MHSQEMASQKTERTSDLHGSDSTLSTYVDEKEELQAQAKATSKLRRVYFGTVEVRLYLITLGDNPACSHGPPVRNSSVSYECWHITLVTKHIILSRYYLILKITIEWERNYPKPRREG
jgi:hypothetical protein